MKEETAKTKWCPMVRFHYAGDGVYDNKPCKEERDVEGDKADESSPMCVASDCMMWVWDEGEMEDSGRKTSEGHPIFNMAYSTTHGHCGLARSAGVSK